MPIYEYRCTRGHTFEVLQRMADDPLTACQTCEAPAERVLYAPAVHFKGSGFYNTDYGTRKRAREIKSAGDGKGGEGKGGDGASKSGEGGSSSSSDAKGDGASAAKKADSAPKTSAA